MTHWFDFASLVKFSLRAAIKPRHTRIDPSWSPMYTRVVLIDVAGTTVEEGLSLIDPRLPGQPNWIEGPPSPERPSAKFFFEGETRDDGTLIFRERI